MISNPTSFLYFLRSCVMWTLLLFLSFLLLIQFVCCSNDLFGIRRTHAQRYFCRVVRDSAFLVKSSEELDHVYG